jgi:cytochrome P450
MSTALSENEQFSDFDAIMAAGVDLIEEYHRIILSSVPDHYQVLRRIRQQSPVYVGDVLVEHCGGSYSMASPKGDRPVYTVLGYREVIEVLRDFDSFSSTIYQDTVGKSMGTNIAMVDPPYHTRLRAMMSPAFRKKFSDLLRTEVAEPLVRDRFVGSWRDRRTAELMADFAIPYPVLTIQSMLGLPLDSALELNTIAVGLLMVKTRPDIGISCGNRLGEIVSEVVRAHREAPREDLVTRLIDTRIEGREPLTDEELISFLRILLPAGGETTTKGISSLMVGLLTQPDQLARVRTDRSLIPQAVEEALRWEAPDQFVYRMATKDVVIGGTPIPAGAGVVVALGAANHDETYWGGDPDKFDVTRRGNHQLAFSHGPHSCLGLNVARMELAVALQGLLELPGLRLDEEYPEPEIVGSAFRSPHSVHVTWDAR